ncbi:MAG: carbohydrate binding domain-containing protein, partial [Prevotella sp.]|nr:carbohydrate binding domain-containing protein [Prevotella sp.]
VVGGVNLGGIVTYSAVSLPTGIYNLEDDGYFGTLLHSCVAWAGVLVCETYYYLDFDWSTYETTVCAVDAESWEIKNKMTLSDAFVADELAYDATTGNVYGCCYNDDFSAAQLAVLDFDAAQRVTISTLTAGESYRGMAFDKDGQLYAITETGKLLKVDKETGEETVIGDTGVKCRFLVSAAIDKNSGDLYYTDGDNGALYKINTATAEATKVCDFAGSEEVQGLFIPETAAEGAAPTAATNLVANFTDASLSGTISFKMPGETMEGKTLQGPCTYTISLNGEVVVTNTAMPGVEITENITVSQADNYEIIVIVSNEIGKSPKAKIKKYIGADYASAVKNVAFAYANGKTSLTWDATTSANGGWFDQSKVTYTIERVVGNDTTSVAEGLTDCAFAEDLAEPNGLTKVFYSVTTVYNGEKTIPAESNTIILGAIVPPYKEDFTSAASLDLFTIIDVNGDGKTWKLTNKSGNRAVRITYNDYLDMDDWLITAPIKLEAGKTYDISFKACSENKSYKESVEAFIAKASDIESLKAGTQIASNSALSNEWETLTSSFTPDEDGKYYVGIHGNSKSYMYYLWVDDLTISAGISGNMPGAISQYELVPDENGGLKTSIKVVAPTTGCNGSELTSLTKIDITRNGSVIGEISPVVPGETYTYVDENISAKGLYTYGFSASNTYGCGKEVTASVFVGAYDAPYTQDFESTTPLTDMIIIDANGDGKQWVVNRTMTDQGYVARIAYGLADMDDWLISAPVILEQYKLYDINFKAASYNEAFPERVEAFVITESQLQTLKNTLKLAEGDTITAPTDLASEKYITLGDAFVPQKTSKYYVAIHGISDADQNYLYVDDINISAGKSSSTPIAPEVTVEADPSGSKSATLTITAPTQDIKGEALTAMLKLEVLRDNIVIKTYENVTPGEKLTFVDDQLTENGNATWTIIAYTEADAGLAATATAYIGINVPNIPTDITMVETSPGKVKITWKAPATDIHGKPITGLTYSIIDMSTYKRIVTDLEATEYEIQAVEEGGQTFAEYAVGASNEVGEGEFDVTPFMLVGTPYTYPYTESFNGGYINSVFAFATPEESGATWSSYTDARLSSLKITDADATGGCIGMKGTAVGDKSALYTAKLSLVGAEKPVLTFYYNNMSLENENTLEVAAREFGSDNWTALQTITLNGGSSDLEWVKVVVPLNDFKGKTIQLQWTPTVVNYTYVLLDAIKVDENVDNDLAAQSISTPSKATAGKEFNINVTVVNNGNLAADSYTVNLFRDGKKAQELSCEGLASGANKTITFTEKLNSLMSAAKYHAEIDVADEKTENNMTEEISVAVTVPDNLNAAETLTAEQQNADIKLSWTAPDLNVTPQPVTETFETYDAFALNSAGDWSFIDADGQFTYGFQSSDFPHTGEKMAFLVFDTNTLNIDTPPSGSKFMAAFAVTSGSNDDWLISPQLSGEAQTITFQAKSFSDAYGYDTFEVWYSATDNNKASFQKLAEETQMATDWKLYTYSLPEGAQHFAIRYTAASTFLFMVDDITYTPTSKPLNLLGYNIYCDGEPLAAVSATETTFVSANSAAQEHQYVVTALYEQGESAASNKVVAGGWQSAVNSPQTKVKSQKALHTTDGRAVKENNARGGIFILAGSNKHKKIIRK